MSKLKSLYGWENIKFTLRNIRRQVFELVGVQDPFWDYKQQEAGMRQIENRAAPPKGDGLANVFNNFVAKKEAANDNAVPVATNHAADEPGEKMAA